MKVVSVAALKSNLSAHLDFVKNGREIVVTSHRHPIARVVPIEKAADELLITRASKPVASLKKIRGLNLNFDPVAFLLADRRRR